MDTEQQKIVVLVRTRDEEHRIGEFCSAYQDADLILVADGGSLDRTKEIASSYKNVVVRDYPGRVKLANGYWRNNDSDHVNWLIDWSKEYNPDWVILDDCDCRPNWMLRKNYRDVLLEVEEDFVLVTRIYFWGYQHHFPHMAKPGAGNTHWEPSLWAWRGKVDFKTVDVPPAFTFRVGDLDINDLHVDATACDLLPPLALLHFSWDDPDRVERKVRVYRDSHLIPGQLHPLEFAGPLEPIPWWAKE